MNLRRFLLVFLLTICGQAFADQYVIGDSSCHAPDGSLGSLVGKVTVPDLRCATILDALSRQLTEQDTAYYSQGSSTGQQFAVGYLGQFCDAGSYAPVVNTPMLLTFTYFGGRQGDPWHVISTPAPVSYKVCEILPVASDGMNSWSINAIAYVASLFLAAFLGFKTGFRP